MDAAAATPPVAELVVLNGRQKGNRCPLNGPLTLIGREESCDVRLNLDGIAPYHVALVQGPVGPIVRDVSGEGTVLVNGQRIDNRLLHDGDVLALGPFEFEVCLPPGLVMNLPVAPSDEGLRVQAAAVAAEQVRLTDLEGRLEQRRLALETQEKQVVGLLEERRGRLEALQQQTRQERQDWRDQREKEEADLAALRTALAVQADQIDQERRRLEHESAAVADEARRQADIRQAFDRDRAKLAEERKALEKQRVALNTEVELGRRQLVEERQALHLDQQRWEAVLNEEEHARYRKRQDLAEKEAALAQEREAIAGERYALRQVQVVAQKELRGLEARIRGQRARLTALEQELARKETAQRGRPVHAPLVHVLVPIPAETQSPPAPQELVEVAARLADQRRHLAEQWQRLVEQQREWEAERTVVASDLEETTRKLVRWEAELYDRAAALAPRELALDQRQGRLEAFELRLRVQQADLASERDAALADVAAAEQALADREAAAAEAVVGQRRRTRKAIRRLAQVRAELEALHGRYAVLWEEQQEEHRKRVLAQQEVARQRLALEKMRHEVLARAVNVTVAERKLDRLEKEYLAIGAREEADLRAEWHALDRERGVLNDLARSGLTRLGDGVRQAKRRSRRGDQRRDRAAARFFQRAEEQARLDRLAAERDRAERLAEELRGELERVALNLMGSPEAAEATPESRAA